MTGATRILYFVIVFNSLHLIINCIDFRLKYLINNYLNIKYVPREKMGDSSSVITLSSSSLQLARRRHLYSPSSTRRTRHHTSAYPPLQQQLFPLRHLVSHLLVPPRNLTTHDSSHLHPLICLSLARSTVPLLLDQLDVLCTRARAIRK